jgi:hypothetical protein
MRLPDALLVRDTWLGGNMRQREYDGRHYEGASVWMDEDAARVAAAAIRSAGGLARVTREPLPGRARPWVQIYSRRPARAQKTNVFSPRRDRWMWVVWSSSEKPACAGQMEGPAE